MSTSPQLAFVTLVTSNSYLPGALVVAAALRDLHPSPPIYPGEYEPSEFHRVCLATPETLDVTTMKLLRRAFDVVVGVEVIEEDTEEGLRLLGRLDLSTVLTKLHMFRLTEYRKVIFLDADILPLRPISHLFRVTASFAAVPDVGWPDIFNSGFLVLEPGEEKFDDIMRVVKSKGSWDGGDQGVLNEWVGQNWERLSFTYNTTPTAVYTYAPAYKRFGSQINNIHFIGPNKPWTQIPLRWPGESSSSPPPTRPSQQFEPPSSYGYPALLDRWFAVYDKLYRSSPTTDSDSHDKPLSTETPNIRYPNVWNSSDVQPKYEAETSGAGAPLGLEELRRMAISGVGESGTGSGEGTYHTLPLEGRIDLMRPPKPKPISPDKRSFAVRIVVPEAPQTPLRSITPMTTLPTPGPNELPPAPFIRGHSLPPETPTHARPGHRDVSHVGPDHDYLQPQIPSPLSPLQYGSPPRSGEGHPFSPPRRGSPPLVTWNPATEAPPRTLPPPSHFPNDTYFPNVWDAQSHAQPVPEDNGGLFPVPPPPNIPERLIKEGHYQAVIGVPAQEEPHPHEQVQPLQPSDLPPQALQPTQPLDEPPAHKPYHPHPDRSKVTPVFPWEEKPRQPPARFFPRTDSPPPGQPFVQPQTPALNLNLRESPAPVPFPPSSLSLPQQGFPRTTSYANAWDAVPSIQRYASRLVRPAAALPANWTPDTGPTKRGSGKGGSGLEGYRSWQDMLEVGSRDADDEDEDDEDEDGISPFNDPSETTDDHPPSSSSSRKSYKGRGVQTVPKQTKNQGVQVSIKSRRHVTLSASGNANANGDQRGRADDTHSEPDDDQAHHAHSPPAHGRTRESRAVGVTRRSAVNVKEVSSPVPELLLTAAQPSATSPEGSTTTRQLISPPSSMGQSSPPHGTSPVLPGAQSSPVPAFRPAGRTFDPARDVEVFKKGSEEVLARFLKIDSWEDDLATGTGSPSAV